MAFLPFASTTTIVYLRLCCVYDKKMKKKKLWMNSHAFFRNVQKHDNGEYKNTTTDKSSMTRTLLYVLLVRTGWGIWPKFYFFELSD